MTGVDLLTMGDNNQSTPSACLAEGSNAGPLELKYYVRFPSQKKEHFSLRQLRRALRRFGGASGSLALWAVLNSLAPFGVGVSVIAPLSERLPGLIEGSLEV